MAQRELQLGHRNVSATTDIYTPLQPGNLKDMAAAIEGITADMETIVPGALFV
jgi:hypothetical protein